MTVGDELLTARLCAADVLTYPFLDETITVTHCERICFRNRQVNLSGCLRGQNVGVAQVGEHIWLVTSVH